MMKTPSVRQLLSMEAIVPLLCHPEHLYLPAASRERNEHTSGVLSFAPSREWKSRPYLEGQSRRDDLKVAQDVSPG